MGAENQDKKGEFFFRGDLEIAAQPFLGLSGDLFIEVDARRAPDDANARYKLGLIYKEKGMGVEATKAFRASVARKVASVDALIQQAASHFFLNELDSALERCQQALTREPESIMERYYLGLVQAKKGKFEKAIEHLEWVVFLQPEFTQAISNLALVYNELGQ